MVDNSTEIRELQIKISLQIVQQKKVKYSCVKRVKCSMSKMSRDIFKEQQTVIKFLVKLGKTGMKIVPMLNNY